jgi:predicted N-acetyltransferase YhbS
MTIRPATDRDVEVLVEMSELFASDLTVFGEFLTFNAERVEALVERLIASPQAEVLVADADGVLVGMVAAHLFPHPMASTPVAQEVVWWVAPEQRGTTGLKLLTALSAWAKAQGAEVLMMVSPSPTIDTLYDKLGFSRGETSYMRRL